MGPSGQRRHFGADLSGQGAVLGTLHWLVSLAAGLAAAWAGAYSSACWLVPTRWDAVSQAQTWTALGVLSACLVALVFALRYRWSLVPTLVVLCLLYLVVVPLLRGGPERVPQRAHWAATMTGGMLGSLLGLVLAALARPSASVRSAGVCIGVGWLSMAALCIAVGALSSAARARSFDRIRVADLSERVLPAVEEWLGSHLLVVEPEVRWRTPTESELEALQAAGRYPGTDGEMVRPRGTIDAAIHKGPRRDSAMSETALATGVKVSVSMILELPEPISEEGITTEVLESVGLRPELARKFKAKPRGRGTFVAEQEGVRVAAYPVGSDDLHLSSNYWRPGWQWLRLDCVNFRTSYIPGP